MEPNTHDRFQRLAALKPVGQRAPATRRREGAEFDALTSLLGGEIERNPYGEHVVARYWHATPESCDVALESLRLLLPRDLCDQAHVQQAAADPAKWLFLDTETTGIVGGSGTYAFLVGLAWWESSGLQVEQHFMRDHGEEHSVLLAIAEQMRARPVLVTFNGKSFDWPLLETRFRMTRSIDVPSFAAHLDFLHPARQLWRLQFDSLRLSQLEKHVLSAEALGWSRDHDIDSSRIPSLYFDYLRSGTADGLAGVFLHNRMDLRGLAALAVRILRALAVDAMDPQDEVACELYGVSRLLLRRGERGRARALYERAIAAGLPAPIEHKARYELARLARREKDFTRASQLWDELSRCVGPNPEAWEQLAIHYERREGNLRGAVQAARTGMAKLRRAARMGLVQSAQHQRLLEKFRTRVERLERKLGKETA